MAMAVADEVTEEYAAAMEEAIASAIKACFCHHDDRGAAAGAQLGYTIRESSHL